MRLEGQHQAAVGESAAGCGNHCLHFYWVVAVVVDQCEVAATLGWHFAIALEAATDALEFLERLDDGGIGNVELARHGYCRQCVEHVVVARQVKRDIKGRGYTVDA